MLVPPTRCNFAPVSAHMLMCVAGSAGEVLAGANKYKCPRQQKAVRAIKRMTVDVMPNVLMIQLKRFEFSFSGHKISKKVASKWAFPMFWCSHSWQGWAGQHRAN